MNRKGGGGGGALCKQQDCYEMKGTIRYYKIKYNILRHRSYSSSRPGTDSLNVLNRQHVKLRWKHKRKKNFFFPLKIIF